jgi:hypothetical protein
MVTDDRTAMEESPADSPGRSLFDEVDQPRILGAEGACFFDSALLLWLTFKAARMSQGVVKV